MHSLTVASLIQSARMYQQALWVAESEPSFAWLLLVSAVECAANRWDRHRGSPAERLREAKPKIGSIIDDHCPDQLDAIAAELADTFGATRKFRDFILQFLPEPPIRRPPHGLVLEWTDEALRPLINTIYRHRSNALHAGIPFPASLCEPPWILGDAFCEFPLGGGEMRGDTVWTKKDRPMYLHVFEHIARGALNRWWQEAPCCLEDPGQIGTVTTNLSESTD